MKLESIPRATLESYYAFGGVLPSAVEWKPLLDDATWARGPNYHVAPGATVDVWPHFVATTGNVVTLIPDRIVVPA